MAFEEVFEESSQQQLDEIPSTSAATEAATTGNQVGVTVASLSKVIDIESDISLGQEGSSISGFRIVDMEIINLVINLLACPECLQVNSLKLNDINAITCSACPYTHEFFTSKQVKNHYEEKEKNKGGGSYMEINLRAVYGMRSIGAGHSPLEKLCGHLNMPGQMNVANYNKLSNKLLEAVKTVTGKSMKDVTAELCGGNETADVPVSVDGTWQHKGFTSTLRKVVDCVILSKSCKGCTSMEKVRKEYPDHFAQWKAGHTCNLNYHGSSPMKLERLKCLNGQWKLVLYSTLHSTKMVIARAF